MSFLEDWGLTFAHPWILLLLFAIPIISYIKGKQGGIAAVSFSSIESLRALGKKGKSKVGDFLMSLVFVAFAFLIIALARPQKGKTISHTEASGIDIMLTIDVSRSMLAEDFHIGNQRANRLDAVKKVTEQFIEGRPNDRIGIVAFAGKPYLVSPLTLDHDWLFRNLERVTIGMVEDGTAIGAAIASASNRLKDKESKSKIIVLLTDGDNNSGKISPLTAAEASATLGIKIYTIGAGTDGLAPFPVGKDIFGRIVYENVKFPTDEPGLKKIAEVTKGEFYQASGTKSLENIYKKIDQLEKSKVEFTHYREYRDLFPWFLAAGLLLISLETLLSQTLWRKLP